MEDWKEFKCTAHSTVDCGARGYCGECSLQSCSKQASCKYLVVAMPDLVEKEIVVAGSSSYAPLSDIGF